MKKVLFIGVPLLLVGAAFVAYRFAGLRPIVSPPATNTSGENLAGNSNQAPQPSDPELSYLTLPPGFSITLFAEGLGGSRLSSPGPARGSRLMTVRGNAVYVAVPGQGRVAVLKDVDGNGRAEPQADFISDLANPHNVAFSGDWVYIATESRLLRVKDADQDHVADTGTLEELMRLPTGGHWTRTVKIFGDKLYVSIGSSCNVCREQDTRRASIIQCDLEGKACQPFAQGLRNTVDFIEHDGRILGTDNGRDYLGNDLPPEEVNVIEADKNYGWPICYGQRIHDTNFDKNQYVRDPCASTQAPLVELPAHIAPLGLSVYTGSSFPAEYRGDLFVASHGSWNRQPPAGYKVLRINLETGKTSDFVTGWLQGSVVLGRPVGVIEFNGALLISDDATGTIYRVSYQS